MSSNPADETFEPGSVAARFEDLWSEALDRCEQSENIPWPDARAFLNEVPKAAPADRLAVYLIDQRERWKRGFGIAVETYLDTDREVARDLEMVTALVQGEFAARRYQGEVIDLEEFAARFPKLRNALIGLVSQGDIDRLKGDTDLHTSFFVPVSLMPGETLAERPCVSVQGLQTQIDPSRKKGFGEATNRQDLDSAELGFVIETDVPTCDDPTDVSEPSVAGLAETARFAIQHPPLGKGGMGIVYQAYDRERRETVALKTMKRVEPIALYRFKNEFRTLADLSHPNLVNLYELIAVGDLWFFTMELIRGVDFIDYVQGDERVVSDTEERPWPFQTSQEKRLRQALVQLVSGLIALHDAGKLHRDIKPTNVLVTPEGRVVLLDFGVSANMRASLWQTPGEDRVVGTAGYIAPEQLFGSRLTTACDWYSVGVMLYFALAGRLPFSGDASEVLIARQRSSPSEPRLIRDGVPDDLNDLCVALLSIDPRDRPDGRSILARVSGTCETAIAHPRRNLSWSTIGREPHREILEASYQSVCEGRSVLLLVSGRSGSGKSMLIQSFLADLMKAEDVAVFAGRCHERESVPYKALDSVVDALSRYLADLDPTKALSVFPDDIGVLARMFPVLRRVKAIDQASQRDQTGHDGHELRRRAIAALRDLLRRIGRARPLILAIDDLHWGDVENASLLQDLLSPPDPPLMLLIASYRTEDAEASPLIQALLESMPTRNERQPFADKNERTDNRPQYRELTVGPLTYAESRALALELLDRRDSTALAAAHIVAKESCGNPYFIVELINAIPVDGERAARPSLAGHLAIDAVIWERINALPDPARRLLDVIAISGRPIRLLDAYHAAGLDSDGRAAAAVLRSARLVRGTGANQRDEVETYHELVRDTALAHLPAESLAALHLRLAHVIESSNNADSESLAFHFHEAGLKNSAAEHYERAADRAMDNLAFFHASKLYRRVLELRTRLFDLKESMSLWIRLGDSLAYAGRGREAADAYLSASESADPAEALELKRRAAMQLLLSGNYDDAFALIGKGLQARGLSMPTSPSSALRSLIRRRAWLRIRGMEFRRRDPSRVSPERLSLIDLCWSAGAGLSNIEPISGADFQTRGLLLALNAGEPYRIARALTLEAATISLAGARVRDRAERLLERAEGLSNGSGSPHLEALVALGRGIISLMSGSWRQADRWFSIAEPILRQRCKGVAWELDTLHNLRLWALIHLGDLNEVRRVLPGLKREARERGDLYALTNLSGYASTLLRLAEDEPDLAEAELNDATLCWPHRGFHLQHSAFFRARVAIHLYRGDGISAWNEVQKAWPFYRNSLLPRIQVIRVQLTKLRAHCALVAARDSDNPAPFIQEAERAAQSLAKEGVGWSQAYARLILAGVGAFIGSREMRAKALMDAADFQKENEMTLCAAATLRRAGESLEGHSGHRLLEAADAYFQSQGVREPARFTHLLAPDCFPYEDRTPTTLGDRRCPATRRS